MANPATKLSIDRKARLRIPHQPVPKQDIANRIQNWDEVALGYDFVSAQIEASRCIQCPAAPCQKACPLHNDIPGALLALENGDPLTAAAIFRKTSFLPAICGRLCPQERLCEGACVVRKVSQPVAIGRLEAFSADEQQKRGRRVLPSVSPPTGRRVAVIGSGPAGLAAAEELALNGHAVDIFEAWPQPGGVLVYGIPTFKLAKEHVYHQIAYLTELGIQFHTNVRIGDTVTIDDLFAQGFHAIFLSHGASQPNLLQIPGEDLPGVYSATEFLVRANLAADALPNALRQRPLTPHNVIVIGGGDTAMDCARTAIRLGAASVHCVYRRSEAEMPGRLEERRYAHEEGVQFVFLAIPQEILPGPTGHIQAVRFLHARLGDPDPSGRPRPIPISDSAFELPASAVVIAAGYSVDQSLTASSGITTTLRGTIATSSTGATSRPGVFAAGDCVRGADLVVTALADARQAARAIDAYLAALPASMARRPTTS